MELNVAMGSSEHFFPYTLREHGVDPGKLTTLIFAEEIPPKDMISFLLKGKGSFGGVGRHLAHLLVSAYGGTLFLMFNALKQLSVAHEEFRLADPTMVRALVCDADDFLPTRKIALFLIVW